LWPFSTLGWPDVAAKDFNNFYPTNMLETGYIPFFLSIRKTMAATIRAIVVNPSLGRKKFRTNNNFSVAKKARTNV